MNKLHIVGIGGLPRSGKDSLAELLIRDGYFGVSFGDIVREFAYERHKDKPDPISVANMTETSNWLRHTRGSDAVLLEALGQFEAAQLAGKSYEGLVLWSIRAPVEVDFILGRGGDLIWVEASPEVRHERALGHLRPGEIAITMEEFQRQEDLQWRPQKDPNVPKEVQMDISYVKQHATHILENNTSTLDGFLEASEKLIHSLYQS